MATSAAADEPTGTALGTASAAEPVPSTVVAAASDLPGAAQQVALTDENLFVQTGTGSTAVTYWRPLAGGEWSTTWGGRELVGELIAAENDVVHLRTTQGESLTWTRDHDGDGVGGGKRSVPVGSVLGHGAEYVAYTDGEAHVQAVGSAGDVWSYVWGRAGIAMYGDEVITASNGFSGTTVWRDDIRDGQYTRGGVRCTGGSDALTRVIDANERFALARCADGQVWLQDHAEVYYPFTLSGHYSAEELRIGAGFVLGTDLGTGSLRVTPLADAEPGTLGAAADVDLDDAGRTAVLVDPAGDVRTADLSGWSSQMRTVPEDLTPPTAGMRIASNVVTTTSYVVALTATDGDNGPAFYPADIALVESEYRVRARGSATPGPWTPGPTLQPRDLARYYSGSFRAQTGAPGSETCWRVRATDTAGNIGAWSADRCVVVDSTAPVITASALPSSTRSTATSTGITFRYQAKDNGKVASYDVRWRRTPRGGETGAWVYPKSYQGTTATSATAYSTKSTITCFQARARDVVGNVSGWSPLRCTYMDGTRPTVRWTSYPRWVTPSQTWLSTRDNMMVSKPAYTYGASDERGVVGYEVQRREWEYGETLTWAPSAYTGTTVRFKLYTGEQNCNRVRARDQAGNWSAWSGWKCTNMPFDQNDTYVNGGRQTGRYSYVIDGYSGTVQSNNPDAARAIRAKFVTGPDRGSVRVSVGRTSFGVVHTWAPEPGTKWVTLRAPVLARGDIRFTRVNTNWRDVHLREFYAIR
ncbi:hypothetical protein ACO229_21145 [Promicromonospora sp. MS192]|uniref:hypothetical protein n=1 Tax=Promicromonospora sp. MS192 TaxID=3412684 RepID=UPI003C2E9725